MANASADPASPASGRAISIAPKGRAGTGQARPPRSLSRAGRDPQPPLVLGQRRRVTLNRISATTTIDGPDGVSSTIAETLAEIDAANAPTYAANAAELHTRLADLGTEIAGMVAPVRGRPFIVFHDAYRYFEDRFGLAAAGSAVVSADRSPGVRRIRELQGKVRDLDLMCVMAEPQFEPRLVSVIVEGMAAKAGSVDPLGATIESGPGLYFTLLRNMAASFKDCLSG